MPTPEQKRQAAAIFTAASEGKVIERQHTEAWKSCDPFNFATRCAVLDAPQNFRIAPDPIAPGWNPDKLTVSQVGDGWRLISMEEGFKQRHTDKWWQAVETYDFDWLKNRAEGSWINEAATLRTRLSVEALAALDKPAWRLPDPPAGGPPWHREDWKQSFLPQGYRPLLMGEKPRHLDEYKMASEQDDFFPQDNPNNIARAEDLSGFWRTLRPLPSVPRTRPWSKPQDVPGQVCWIAKSARPTDPFGYSLIVAIQHDGIACFSKSGTVEFFSWNELQRQGAEYSLDRKTWAKCETTEAE